VRLLGLQPRAWLAHESTTFFACGEVVVGPAHLLLRQPPHSQHQEVGVCCVWCAALDTSENAENALLNAEN
jgi:hypothetical protein